MSKQHENNRDILVKNGFIVTQYVNTTNRQVLIAHHKDGRKVEVIV